MSNSLPLVVANLKANKSWDEVSDWIDDVAEAARNFKGILVFCPSYPFLASSFEKISQNSINLKLGAQDLSHFEQGAYTGEVAASQIADLVKFAIIGHSERRKNFGENDELLALKVENAQKAGIEPIFCVQKDDDFIPADVNIIAYEPVFAIGTGNSDTPENIKEVCEKLRARGEFKILYGGSASAQNVKSIIDTSHVDGFLIGATNSLDPQKFIDILNALK